MTSACHALDDYAGILYHCWKDIYVISVIQNLIVSAVIRGAGDGLQNYKLASMHIY